MSPAKNKSKNINLLPREDFDKTTLGRILKWALTTFRFIVIVVEFIVISGFLSRFYLDVRIGDLEEEIKQQSALIDSRHEFEEEFRKAQTKLSVVAATSNTTTNKSLDIINTLSREIPQDTKLISVNKTSDLLTIRGASISELSISIFLSSLKKLDNFTDVSVVRLEKESDSPFNVFTIEAKIT